MTTQQVEQQTLDAPTEPLVIPSIEGEEGYAPEIVPESTPEPPIEAPTLDDYTQGRLRRADELENQQRDAEAERAVAQEMQNLRTEMASRNYAPEDQEWLVSRYSRLIKNVAQEQLRFREEQTVERTRTTAAQTIAKDAGIDPQLLMGANSEQDMRQIATREKRYLDQEVRLQAVEKRGVPAQNLNQTGTSRVGGQAVTSDNVDALWLAGRITDEQYRAFLKK